MTHSNLPEMLLSPVCAIVENMIYSGDWFESERGNERNGFQMLRC